MSLWSRAVTAVTANKSPKLFECSFALSFCPAGHLHFRSHFQQYTVTMFPLFIRRFLPMLWVAHAECLYQDLRLPDERAR